MQYVRYGECSDEFIYSTSTTSVSLARMGVLIGIGTLIYKNTFEGVEALIRKGGGCLLETGRLFGSIGRLFKFLRNSQIVKTFFLNKY